jgi:hypothetical protein
VQLRGSSWVSLAAKGRRQGLREKKKKSPWLRFTVERREGTNQLIGCNCKEEMSRPFCVFFCSVGGRSLQRMNDW